MPAAERTLPAEQRPFPFAQRSAQIVGFDFIRSKRPHMPWFGAIPSRYTLPKPKSVAAKCMFSTIQAALQYAASCLLSRDTDTRITVGAPYVGRKDGSPRKAAPHRSSFSSSAALWITLRRTFWYSPMPTGAALAALRISSRFSFKICCGRYARQDRRRLIASMTSIETASCLHFLWQRLYAAYFRIRIIAQISLLHTKRIEFFAFGWTQLNRYAFFLDKSLFFVDTI